MVVEVPRARLIIRLSVQTDLPAHISRVSLQMARSKVVLHCNGETEIKLIEIHLLVVHVLVPLRQERIVPVGQVQKFDE